MTPFIERSLRSAIDFFKEAVFSEEIAAYKGLLQAVDARIKIVALIFFLGFTLWVRSLTELLILYLVSVSLAKLSGIKVIFFLKRVWFFIPIFTLAIVAPAVFMYGPALALIFILRVTTCVSYAVLITLVTRHADLLRALRSLGIPTVFVMVLDMTYRYLFLFIKAFEEMHLSLKARIIKKFAPHAARRWIASRIAFLFRRSMKMSEEVYMAMTARGYTGEIKRYDK